MQAVAAVFPELLKVVNLILLPAEGVAQSPIAMLIWLFLILGVCSAVWAFVQGFMSRRGRRA